MHLLAIYTTLKLIGYFFKILWKIDTNVILKIEDDIISAVEHFNTCVQNAAWNSTPQIRKNNSSIFPTNITPKERLEKSGNKLGFP